ncbi:MAG: hypothetical protein WCO06_02560 [Candidatus Roizmanbacteria bacterium]
MKSRLKSLTVFFYYTYMNKLNVAYVLYGLTLFLIALYSYVLIDPNITLFSNSLWAMFREQVVKIGYYQRELSSYYFIASIIVLFLFQIYFLRQDNVNIKLLTILLIVFAIIAYPLLSHDFFNYLFDAKILTFYGQNPYLHKALDFPYDPWIRFMHWTHRTYPYGPIFLIITLIPSFLSFGKFIFAYYFFKIMFALFFVLGVFSLNKLNKKWAIFFITSPIVIVEGLMNLHNDLIGVSLGLYGLFLLSQNKQLLSRVVFVLSGGIKYFTFPILITFHTNKLTHIISLLGIVGLIGYVSTKMEIQPWYFLNLLVFLPYYYDLFEHLSIFFAGLIVSYYPFIRYGEWSVGSLEMKHTIMYVFLGINVLYILIQMMISYRSKAHIK